MSCRQRRANPLAVESTSSDTEQSVCVGGVVIIDIHFSYVAHWLEIWAEEPHCSRIAFPASQPWREGCVRHHSHYIARCQVSCIWTFFCMLWFYTHRTAHSFQQAALRGTNAPKKLVPFLHFELCTFLIMDFSTFVMHFFVQKMHVS